MKIIEAVDKAIRGGWLGELTGEISMPQPNHIIIPIERGWWSGSLNDIVMDRNFCQALGKSMGWEGYRAYKNGWWVYESEDKRHMSDTPFRYPYWLLMQHQLIDHLTDGETIESYFETL